MDLDCPRSSTQLSQFQIVFAPQITSQRVDSTHSLSSTPSASSVHEFYVLGSESLFVLMSVLLFRDDPADPRVHPNLFMEIAPPAFHRDIVHRFRIDIAYKSSGLLISFLYLVLTCLSFLLTQTICLLNILAMLFVLKVHLSWIRYWMLLPSKHSLSWLFGQLYVLLWLSVPVAPSSSVPLLVSGLLQMSSTQ